MKWIDSTDLRSWATRIDSQQNLPLLVRKLIRATSSTIQNIKFPAGESVSFGGWDGILEVHSGTEYLPEGISLWEFGVGVNSKAKADSDYKKRTENPIGFDPSNSTFVFVTPRLWNNSEEWVKEKKKEGIWKDIKVMNSETLEEWIETAPTVGAWLSKQIGRFPSGGIQPCDDFWEEWSSGETMKLNESVILSGRDLIKNRLIEIIDSPIMLAVEGMSKEEALAFIIASFKSNIEKEEDFFSRSLIVDNPDTFRQLAVMGKPLILIPRFEDNGVINRALSHGHTVIIPICTDSSLNWSNKLKLPKLEREGFISALVENGLSPLEAEKISKETTRNITILRRRLRFVRTIPDWASPENVRIIIPALIVGRWDESFDGDKEIISKIYGDTYENYIKELTRWLHSHDSPLIKIDNIWRLTSPFDAWSSASMNLTRGDFEILHKSFMEILSEPNPILQVPSEKRFMAGFYGVKSKYSHRIKEGITQSLILTSLLSDNISYDLPHKADLWVDNVVNELLSINNEDLWKSFEGLLPLLAEASPIAFLDRIEQHLSSNNSPIVALFHEENGFLSSYNFHTGLLWALESLAWFPKYLSRVTLILAKLNTLDPGGQLSNRPINSLSEIFKPWYYQTSANLNERKDILKLISEREPETAWTLLNRMLPHTTRTIAHPTYKTRWRNFGIDEKKKVTLNEINDIHTAVVNLLITRFAINDERLADLLTASASLAQIDRQSVLEFANSIIEKIEYKEFIAWNAVRKLLAHHRSYPDLEWALAEDDLKKYEEIYLKLTPENIVDANVWMFNDHWPRFTDVGNVKMESNEEKTERVNTRRVEGLSKIYKKYGVEKIFELIDIVSYPHILGDTYARIIENENEIIELLKIQNNGQRNQLFIQGFMHRISLVNGVDAMFSLFEKLTDFGLNKIELVSIILPVNQSQKIWDFIKSSGDDVCTEYWSKVNANFYNLSVDEKIYGLQKLVEHKRYWHAIQTCGLFTEEIPTSLIVEILTKAGTEKTDEHIRVDGYELTSMFETINKRSDIDLDELIKLEWLFFPLLDSYRHLQPKNLHMELAKNPSFFMEVFKCLYIPDDESKLDEVTKGLSAEQIHGRATQAHSLLESWTKIPGVNDEGNIDYEVLRNWVLESRKLAEEYGRLDSCDIQIGRLLAHYPQEQGKQWPPEEICKIVEEIGSEDLDRNLRTAVYNKYGFSSRGPFDGGIIEKEKANKYRDYSNSCRNTYPRVSKILEELAIVYEKEAKQMDDEAARDSLEY